MKRFLFAYQPGPDESLIGAFGGACHEHRLRSLKSGIEGAGLSVPRLGNLQVASEHMLECLATVMRTDPATLRACAFETLDARGELMLGDLTLPRQLFDLRRRRIAPRTLRTHDRHRTDWLNRLLPYCPITLERLVGECGECGPLGWRTTRGIAACEICGCIIPPSEEPALIPSRAGWYRLAASLMSRNPETSATAMAGLPAPLSARPRTEIVQLMIRSGFFAAGHTAIDLRRALNPLSLYEIASIVTDGASMIADWPRTIRQIARRRAHDIGDDLVAYSRLRRDLKWLGNGSQRGAEIVTMAFPKIDGRSAEMFADETGYYTTTETNTRLWCKSADLERLRDAGAVDWETLPSKRRRRIRYSAQQIDALADALDDCLAPSSAAVSLDIPTYAVEQLVTATRLQVRDEPGVIVLRGVQISQRSVDEFKRQVTAAANQELPEHRLTPLRRALAGYPGEKPWSGVVDALLANEVRFRIPDGPFSLRRLLIDPAALQTLSILPEGRPGYLVSNRVALRDAYEILGVGDDEASHAILAKGLEIIADGKGKSVCRYALRELCAEIAFTSEIAVFAGLEPDRVRSILGRLGIRRVHGAWSRDGLLRHGLVRPVQEPPASDICRTLPGPSDRVEGASPRAHEAQFVAEEPGRR